MENMVNPTRHLSVARVQALRILHGKRVKSSCTLCSAVAYCCGAVAPCAIAALLGRFLPRLGPLANASGPFFFPGYEHCGRRQRAFASCMQMRVILLRPGMAQG